MTPRIVPLIAAVLALSGTATLVRADVSLDLTQRASCSVQATPSGCTNNPGPYITLNGELRLSGVSARIILTNNRKFTHVASTDVWADVVLIPAGESIKINKQPSQGGVGGNPWIYFQFTDGKGGDYGRPQLLGRCVQGLTAAALDFKMPTHARANVTSGGCSNSPGPYVSLNGELKLGGLSGEIILTNNRKFTHATSADVVVSIVLIPDGESIVFAKQPPLGGAGGNPLIYLQFLDGSGNEIGKPFFIGRCNKL